MQTGQVPFHTLVYLLITGLTCLVILLIVTKAPDMNNPVVSVFAKIGFYSYFIYLFHYFFIVGLDMVLDALGLWMSFWLKSGVVLGMTYAAAYLSYRVYEGPLMGYGRRLEKRIGKDVPPTALAARAEK